MRKFSVSYGLCAAVLVNNLKEIYAISDCLFSLDSIKTTLGSVPILLNEEPASGKQQVTCSLINISVYGFVFCTFNTAYTVFYSPQYPPQQRVINAKPRNRYVIRLTILFIFTVQL